METLFCLYYSQKQFYDKEIAISVLEHALFY
jgi:hypothetical protein